MKLLRYVLDLVWKFCQLFYLGMICKIKDDLTDRKCLNFKTHKTKSDTDKFEEIFKRQLLDRQTMYKISSIWVVAYDLIWVEKRKD